MKLRVIVCGALVALVAGVPAATAQQQRQQSSQHAQSSQAIGDGIADELLTAGVNAGVAKWAPGLEQYLNPVGAGLSAVQAQLAEITNKLNQLISHSESLEAKLNCAIQRTGLNPVLGDARAWFKTLNEQQYVPDLAARKENFKLLFDDRLKILAAQEHLHLALINSNGAIRACAEHIQIGLRPFFSSDIGDEVNNFYAIYHVAAAELLIVRANLMALYPGHFPANAAKEAASQQKTWWAEERSWIKPTFPAGYSYDTQSGVVWEFGMIPHQAFQTGIVKQLQSEGWWVTGFNDIPTCSAIEATFRKSGFTGYAAITWMYRHRIIWVNGPPKVICYDDHGRLHEFDLATYSYLYAGDHQSYAAAIAARPNVRDGKTFINVAHYAYTSLTP